MPFFGSRCLGMFLVRLRLLVCETPGTSPPPIRTASSSFFFFWGGWGGWSFSRQVVLAPNYPVDTTFGIHPDGTISVHSGLNTKRRREPPAIIVPTIHYHVPTLSKHFPWQSCVVSINVSHLDAFALRAWREKKTHPKKKPPKVESGC